MGVSTINRPTNFSFSTVYSSQVRMQKISIFLIFLLFLKVTHQQQQQLQHVSSFIHLFDYLIWPSIWDIQNNSHFNNFKTFWTTYSRIKILKYCIIKDAIIWRGAHKDKGSDAVHYILKKINYYTGE